jgi:hypothetical protein
VPLICTPLNIFSAKFLNFIWRSYVRASEVHLWSTTNKMQRFLDLFISINCSTCFRRFLRPSSGAQNCTYSVRYCQINISDCCYRGWDGTTFHLMFQAVFPPIIRSTKRRSISSTNVVPSHPRWQLAAVLVWQYLTYVQFCAPDDGRKNRLKHVEQFIEINISRTRCILLVVL